MYEGFKFDDQSARKNEWHIRMAHNGIRISFAAFREDCVPYCSERTQLPLHGPHPKRWVGFESFKLLVAMRDSDLGIDAPEFWNRTIPGLSWVNADLFPSACDERKAFCQKIARETEQAECDLLFCDLGTGLATIRIMERRPSIRSQVHLYWDELRDLHDSTSASIAIYQHGRRQPWPEVIDEYRAALEGSQSEFEVLQLKSGRARILLLLKQQHASKVRKACSEIASDDKRFKVLDSAQRLIAELRKTA